MAGYSGTPLAQKLGIKEGTEVLPVGAPAGYRKLLAPLPADVRFATRLTAATDVVHLFTKERSELEKSLNAWYGQLRPDGSIWVSWPKKASGVERPLQFHLVMDFAQHVKAMPLSGACKRDQVLLFESSNDGIAQGKELGGVDLG